MLHPLPEQVLQDLLHLAGLQHVRDHLVHQRGRPLLQPVQEARHLLAGEDLRRVLPDHLGEVRGDDAGRVHHGVGRAPPPGPSRPRGSSGRGSPKAGSVVGRAPQPLCGPAVDPGRSPWPGSGPASPASARWGCPSASPRTRPPRAACCPGCGSAAPPAPGRGPPGPGSCRSGPAGSPPRRVHQGDEAVADLQLHGIDGEQAARPLHPGLLGLLLGGRLRGGRSWPATARAARPCRRWRPRR